MARPRQQSRGRGGGQRLLRSAALLFAGSAVVGVQAFLGPAANSAPSGLLNPAA